MVNLKRLSTNELKSTNGGGPWGWLLLYLAVETAEDPGAAWDSMKSGWNKE